MTQAHSNFGPTTDRPSASWVEWLRHGQALEAHGHWDAAIDAYDCSIAAAQSLRGDQPNETRRGEALAWMNRGNALQKFGEPEAISAAIVAYDNALSLFQRLPLEADPALRNSLGAAWMNRGRALQLIRDERSLTAAIESHEQAIAVLGTLPLNLSPAYPRNLAGAWLNLADALLGSVAPGDHARSRNAAREALALVIPREELEIEFADLSLKARRALVDAIGWFLCRETTADRVALASEAGDAIDDGLAVARRWEARGITAFRPLAVRLFRFGAELYRLHQPHFLAEFLLENLPPPTEPQSAFAGDAEFLNTAAEALDATQAELDRPRWWHVGDAESEKLLRLSHDLAAVADRITRLRTHSFPLFSRP